MTSAIATERTTFPLQQLVTRIRAEYVELPGLRLTLHQASRLFGIEKHACEQVLTTLVANRFLKTMQDGSFIRRS